VAARALAPPSAAAPPALIDACVSLGVGVAVRQLNAAGQQHLLLSAGTPRLLGRRHLGGLQESLALQHPPSSTHPAHHRHNSSQLIMDAGLSTSILAVDTLTQGCKCT
jgi:hypothetical protein